jgi:hypothetical protein
VFSKFHKLPCDSGAVFSEKQLSSSNHKFMVLIAGWYQCTIFRNCSWLGLINVCKNSTRNFHLQIPSTIGYIEWDNAPNPGIPDICLHVYCLFFTSFALFTPGFIHCCYNCFMYAGHTKRCPVLLFAKDSKTTRSRWSL